MVIFCLFSVRKLKEDNPTFIQLTGDIPGGGVEKGELPRDGALRECVEEAGVKLDRCSLKLLHEDSQLDTSRIRSLLA